jgi:hypothetical protein
MNIKFTLHDSISKILATCEKIPSYKQVRITIPAWHPLYEHEWRWKQLADCITTHHLQVVFVCQSFAIKQYFDHVGLQTILYTWSSLSTLRLQFLHALTLQPFFMQGTVKKMNPFSWLIVWAQITVFLVILYIMWWLLSPNAHITFFPSHSVENIVYNFLLYPDSYDATHEKRWNMPLVYTTGSFIHTESISVPVQNIDYDITNARIEVALINTLPTDYSFLANTVFTTTNGITYSREEEIFLPAASVDGTPGRIVLELTAFAFQQNWLPIGERWNLKPHELLYIQKLDESMLHKHIYAEPIRIITHGITRETGTVQEHDIFNLEVRVRQSLEQRLKEIVFQHFKDTPFVVIPFDDMMSVRILSWNTEQLPWTQATSIAGNVQAHITYAILSKKHILSSMNQYIKERPQSSLTFSHIDYSHIAFLSRRIDPDKKERMVVPIVIPLVWRYSLQEDSSMLLDLTHKVLWVSKQAAISTILQHPAIGDVDITLRPPRYGVLPVIPSRISYSVSNRWARSSAQ